MKDEQTTIEIFGWKGKSGIFIEMEDDQEIFIVEHRKDKEDGSVTEQVTRLQAKWVKNLWSILLNNCDVGETYGYRFLVEKIKEFYKIEIDTDAWNGGKNRSKYFFKYHYYPLKVLEAKGYIQYFGNGSVARIL